MSKSRFTTTDVQAMVRDIRANVMGQRLANVYDLSEKCYLLKFAVPGKSEKVTIMIESGVRFHTTKYARDLPELPSAFAMKLRKYVRTKRLEDVRQIGIDRVVDFKFGSGDAVNHIILEMYANGNIVLTDGNYEVLALLRSHQFADDVSLKVGELYPIGYSTNAGEVNPTMGEEQGGMLKVTSMSLVQFQQWAKTKLSEHREFHAHEELAHAAAVAARQAVLEAEGQQAEQGTSESSKRQKGTGGAPQRKPKQPQAPAQSGPKRKKARDLVLKQLLLMKDSGVASCGLEILDHCLVRAGLRPSTRVEALLDISQETLSLMQEELSQAGTIVDALNSQGMPGYIIIDHKASAAQQGGGEPNTEAVAAPEPEFLEFLPMLFAQHEGKPHLTFGSFDEAVDEYFCKVEGQRLQREAQAAEVAAQRKIEKVQRDQEKMLRGLTAQQERMQLGASLLEAHAEEVDKVALVINSALGSGMTWEDIDEMVKTEAAAGNPIASLISRLNLQRNRVFLKLRDIDGPASASVGDASLFDSDSEGEGEGEGNSAGPAAKRGPKLVEVEFDLTLSAFANARKMYSQKKLALEKEARTVDSAARALQTVGERVLKGVEDQKLKRNLRAVRKVHWFEKFNWCISSEGYLILSGRDAQQNEILFKRYLRPGDIYVHADISGAASCIVRAKSPTMQATGAAAAAAGLGTSSGPVKALQQERPISPLAIQEAGVMAVSRSSAWKGKIGGVAAWWVWASQVSKSAPTGEYLTAGSFMIHGKKNFLPPMALEMGFGVMFRLDDASVSRHLKDWKDRSYLGDDKSVSQYTDVLDRYAVDFNELSLGGDDGEGDIRDEATFVKTEKASAAPLVATKQSAAKPEKVSNSQLKKDKRAARKKGAAAQQPADSDAMQLIAADDSGLEEIHGEQGEQGERATSGSDDEEIDYGRLKKGVQSVPANKKDKKNVGDEEEDEGKTINNAGGAKKKHMSKKKARRYAEQDEEDRELAMLVLGHSSAKTGERLGDKQAKVQKEKKSQDLKARQEKAGIGLVKEESWAALLELLPGAVRAVLEGIIGGGFLRAGELDAYEMKALAAFPPEQGVEILYLFGEGANLKKAGNKSGFLAGIMRRYSSAAENPKQQAPPAAADVPAADLHDGAAKRLGADGEDSDDDPADQSEQALSRRALKKKEQEEIQAIIDEEGIAEEEEGKQADEVEKITGMPLPDDVLLYAIPVCGPYASMQNVRYKVKLTPGLGKKGKICKQALDLFSRAKELTAQERALMNGLTDPEMVSIMIGDARISMPGLHQLQQAEKKSTKKSRGQKK